MPTQPPTIFISAILTRASYANIINAVGGSANDFVPYLDDTHSSDNPHLTLYYGHPVIRDYQGFAADAVRYALAASGDIALQFAGLGMFSPSERSDGKVPLVALINSHWAHSMHQEFVHAADAQNWGEELKQEFSYTPHVTLTYLEPGPEFADFQVPSPAPAFDINIARICVYADKRMIGGYEFPIKGAGNADM